MESPSLLVPVLAAANVLEMSTTNTTHVLNPVTLASHIQEIGNTSPEWVKDFNHHLVRLSTEAIYADVTAISSVTEKFGKAISYLSRRQKIELILDYEKSLGSVEQLSNNGIITPQTNQIVNKSLEQGGIDIGLLLTIFDIKNPRDERHQYGENPELLPQQAIAHNPIIKGRNTMKKLADLPQLLEEATNPENFRETKLEKIANRLVEIGSEFNKINPAVKIINVCQGSDVVTDMLINLSHNNDTLYKISTDKVYGKFAGDENYSEYTKDWNARRIELDDVVSVDKNVEKFMEILEDKLIGSFIANQKKLAQIALGEKLQGDKPVVKIKR